MIYNYVLISLEEYEKLEDKSGAYLATDLDGTKGYFKNGALHRLDGPAVIYSDGARFYYKQGMFHREDGPAVIHANGYVEYYINNIPYKGISFASQLTTSNMRIFLIDQDNFKNKTEKCGLSKSRDAR